jgi:hypothetical protein
VSASASAGTVNGTAGAVTVSFTASTNPGKPSGNYVATSSPGSVTASAASSPITFSAGTLTAGTAYTFSIVKQSGSGITSDAATTGSVTPFTVPAAPTSVSASANATSGQIVVSWTAPNNGGSAITNYYVDYSTSSTFASGVTTINTGSTSTSRTVSSLTNGTTYYFRVRAENAAGQSANSSSANDYPYAPPSIGTQSGSSTATAPSTSTTGVSSVSTTTATLVPSVGSGGTFYDYERISGTAVTPSGNSLSGLAENTAHEWRVRVTNSSSTFSLTTRFTPNGSATTVSVEYGTSTSYGTSAGSVSIGSVNTEVASSWNLGSSTSGTIYWRATATYRGGATVQTTGSIARAVSIYNGSSTGSFTTYTTHTKYGNSSATIATKPPYGVDISSISYEIWGAGAGGATYAPGGGGGGGGYRTASGRSSSDFIAVVIGAAGAANGYGNNSSYRDSGGTFYSGRGTPGAYRQGGACEKYDGTYNYGNVGGEDSGGFYVWSGGGGGAGGAGGGGFYGENGGAGAGSGSRGQGGPGTYWSVALGEGAGSGGGVAGGGRGGFFTGDSSGQPAPGYIGPGNPNYGGYYIVTYIGPA